jgi:UDP-glucose 4-epimerase
MQNRRRVAVTGSNGFIGKKLVEHLIHAGNEVVEVSRQNGRDIYKWSTIKDIEKCDVIVHLAARTYVPDSFEEPREFHLQNIAMTGNAAELAHQWGAKMIYMSSYLYGSPLYTPIDEKHPVDPHNPYAHSKYLSELLCQSYAKDFKIPVVSLRLFNVYGPGQNSNFIIPNILNQVLAGESVTLKDPRPRRDYIHINDVCSAILAAIEWESESNFEVFNLGTGVSTSVEELIALMQEISPSGFDCTFTNEYRPGEVLDATADIQKARNVLGWNPQVDLRTGLKSMLESIRASGQD